MTTIEMPLLPAAACADADPDVFFPRDGQSTLPAKRICAFCPEKLPCLTWALQHENQGVWAGLTPDERYRLRRRAA